MENIVTIHVAQSVMFAGASYTLNCTVVSDFRPVVKWINLKGDHSRITVDEPHTDAASSGDLEEVY